MVKSILILGGTHEALQLAERLEEAEGNRVVTSLAGRVKNPKTPAGKLRLGGFGGVDGLVEYLTTERIDLLIDATHPFAENISKNALAACKRAHVKRIHFLRAEWEPTSEDRWISVPDLQSAASALPESTSAFLALGSQHLVAFSHRKDVRFIARMIEPPKTRQDFDNLKILISRPSSNLEAEIDLLKSQGIQIIVCRNSGGTGAWQKLLAARHLDLPVIMIERPTAPAGQLFSSIDDLFANIVCS